MKKEVVKLKNKPGRPAASKTARPTKQAKVKNVMADGDFIAVIEDYLPSSKRNLKPHVKQMILDSTMALNAKQSFFIPHTVLGVSTVKVVVDALKEEKKSYFKNIDVRVVASKSTEVRGCRVVRYT